MTFQKIVSLRILLHLIVFTSLASAAALSDDTSAVDRYGRLRVAGNKIVDQNGYPVALHGMSLYWSQWMGKYYNYDCVQWLRDDWKCTVVRAACGINGSTDGYLVSPQAELAKVKTVIDACIELGIYVIVDWHDDNAENHLSQSISFFEGIASEYGNTPNLIYEIYNEPKQVSWNTVVKPYADTVVKHIRALDSANLIIVGTPTWSQDVDIASLNPLLYENVAYTLHFYAATHKQALRNKAATALNNGIALFVTEWGTCESTGTGILDSVEVGNWSKFMNDNMLSWCNWAIDDKVETSAALNPGAGATGNWLPSDLTKSGVIVRNMLLAWQDPLNTGVALAKELPTRYKLFQNYPNPFNPSTIISYALPAQAVVLIEVYNVLGQRVASLFHGVVPAGNHSIVWDAHNYSSGIYFYRIKAEGKTIFDKTQKLILLR